MKRFSITTIAFNGTGANWFKLYYKLYKFNKDFTISKTFTTHDLFIKYTCFHQTQF